MANAGKPISQRQLRVGEMIKQSLSMIFLKDEAKIPDINTKEITVTEVRMSTYISKIGIYDKDKNLIGVAKLATPVRKTESRSYTFKMKLDF